MPKPNTRPIRKRSGSIQADRALSTTLNNRKESHADHSNHAGRYRSNRSRNHGFCLPGRRHASRGGRPKYLAVAAARRHGDAARRRPSPGLGRSQSNMAESTTGREKVESTFLVVIGTPTVGGNRGASKHSRTEWNSFFCLSTANAQGGKRGAAKEREN